MEDLNNQKIGLLEKCGFMGFATSANIVFNFKSLYYLYFLTNVLMLSSFWAGFIVAVGTVWDAINDPLISLFCTNHTFKNGEKIRPYALYACVPWAITIALMFVNFKLTQSMTVVVCLLIYFVFEALYTFLCMPYNSMASLATKNDGQRKSINAFRSLGGCLGSGIGAVAIISLVKLFGGLKDHDIINKSDSKAVFITACLMGVLCIAGSLFHYFTTKERVKDVDEETKSNLDILRAYKMLFKCKSWVFNMLMIMGYAIATALVMNNVNYYAAYVLGNSDAATPILAIYLVIAIITSILIPTIDKKIGRKKTTIIAILISAIGKIPFILFPRNLICMYINAATFGLGITSIFIIFNTNRNNIADILEVQNGKRIDTLVSGGDNLIAKLSEALALLVMSTIYGFTKMDADLGVNQTSSTFVALDSFLGWVPLIILILMAFVAIKIDTKKEYDEAIALKENI